MRNRSASQLVRWFAGCTVTFFVLIARESCVKFLVYVALCERVKNLDIKK